MYSKNKDYLRKLFDQMYKRIISRLDIKNGVLVKGIGLEGLRNLGNPEHFLKIYYDQKIDELHLQDVVASLYGRDVLFNIIERISKKIFINISVGGGIKDEREVDKLLRLGVDKIIINSAAVKKPSLLEELVKRYGSSTIGVNIETTKIDNKYEIFIETGRERTNIELFRWIDKVQQSNVGEIIVTEISKEGRSKGFNIDLYKNIRKRVDAQLVAHGGAGPLDNIFKLFREADVDGVSIASLFHYKNIETQPSLRLKGSNAFIKDVKEEDKAGISVTDLKKYLLIKKIKVRL